MKTAMIAALAALAALGSATQQGDPPPPLAPTGKWKVEYAESMCVLSHIFGTGASQVILGFRPWPMGEKTEILLISGDSSSKASRYGTGATLSLSSAGPGITGDYSSYWLPKQNMRLVTLTVKQAALADLGSASTVVIAIPKRARISVVLPPNTNKALKALEKCDDDLSQSWGVDPAEKNIVVTSAQALPGIADWITDDDYPPDAILKHQQGIVMVLWAIGVDGRVSNCIPVIKSGIPLLDQAACAAISQRGRYRPALDKDGKPVISHNSRRVIWRLPY